MAVRHAGDAMGVGEAVIVAGIGCRKGASAAQIDAAIGTALERAGRPLARLDLMATAESKREEEGIAAAASARGLRLVFVDQAELEIAGARGATWSSRVLALVLREHGRVGALAKGAHRPGSPLLGRIDFLSVLTNFITVLSYELNYEEQTARAGQALARLESLTGLELVR